MGFTLFEKLVLSHLVGDWLFQNHWMALRKTSDWRVRTLHCLIVSIAFAWLPWYWVLWNFATHWIIDTYKPLYWFRKLKGDYKTLAEFKESFNTPSGFMVNICYDQIFHILCLIPIVVYR